MGVLIGISQIRPKVGNACEATILRWKKEYASFPMRKLGNQWVSESGELENWFKLFCTGQFAELENSDDRHFEAGKKLSG